MLRLSGGVLGKFCFLWLLFSLVANFTWAQSETATVSGQVVDPSGLNITGAQVKLVDIDRDTATNVTSNNSGLYTFPSVRPGRYRMAVTAAGFKVVNVTDLIVNVQDHIEQNFSLQVGSVAESVTVTAGAPLVNTTDATVSTVVDRQFAENLPLNGRSFQSLIELTPGVVVSAVNAQDNGQFSMNGQRASSNYWMVDGVSANIGISSGAIPGNGFGGAAGSFSALGGTNSLVSVDALEEFRLQTSTYAPEFGRTPGGQISIVTRSGTNQFHGTLFDYFRNGVLDANNWFADDAGLAKPQEKQNDFGGTFGGPIVKDRLFFFFSYEGLRLRLPQTVLTTVPDLGARRSAVAAMQPYLNTFPLPNPNAPDDIPNGLGQFNASFSDPGTLDASSLRIDHRLNGRLTLFGRYDYSPSRINNRGGEYAPLSVIELSHIKTQTATVGVTGSISPAVVNDFRFNYSRTDSGSGFETDSFGGAIPLTSLPFPSGFGVNNADFNLYIGSLTNGTTFAVGQQAHNTQRQINVVENLSLQRGTHSLKFGVDFRRLTPIYAPPSYAQSAYFSGVPSAEIGNPDYGGEIASFIGTTELFRNLGVFAQDTWRVVPRLALTYGIRWEFDFVPSSLNGPSIPAVTVYDPNNLAQLALAPPGTPPFKTTYGNVAPRLGLAYHLSSSSEWGVVLRGGFGVFYDLVSAETGNAIGNGGAFPPFGAYSLPSGTFPFTLAQIAPLPISTSGTLFTFATFNPNLKLPYTLEWNGGVEQFLGSQQSLSVTYIGAVGRRLLQTSEIYEPPSNPKVGVAFLTDNTGSSDYGSLQLQFQRRLTHGVQALASYTWSHSIDDGSASSVAIASNAGLSSSTEASNRGPSDFDIRNAFSAGVTYDVPPPFDNAFSKGLLRAWSLQSFVIARSAPPVNVYEGQFFGELGAFETNVRPDVIPGIPLYLYGPQYPGGKIINSTAGAVGGSCSDGSESVGPFCPPPQNSSGAFLRQGDLGRNALRAFGVAQWDLGVHRDFPIGESLKLQFRAEMFNVINHANFGPPNPAISTGGFGQSSQMLNQSLSGGTGAGAGAFNPLYQIGGPRSIQFALKLSF
jgi:carboxypeptidase family protein/TonB-dependent receptor-like protein